jgi:hypothetical protein
MNLPEERRAENEATFREANEAIRDAERRLAPPLDRLPIVCECADVTCREIVRVDVATYETTRAHPRRFFVKAGHEEGTGPVVRGDGWCIVEKDGVEGKVAEERDPRG